MTKIQMPEPAAWLAADGPAVGFKTPMITADQAEAYKDACVREALEAVERICSEVDYLGEVTNGIRALMPKQ